jgi:hypothetical protein
MAGRGARRGDRENPALASRLVQELSWPAVALRAIGIGLLEFADFTPTAAAMKKYMCLICGWIYDEEAAHRRKELHQARDGRTYRPTGRAPNAERARKTSR